MSEPAAEDLAPGELWSALRRRTRSALAAGALAPIAAETVTVPEAGIPFVVRVVEALARRDRETVVQPPAVDPFGPPDPALVVGALGPDHLCVLNKYPVLDHHGLVVTRDFAEQDAPLAEGDLAALWRAVREIDGLGFYNAGPTAGASVRHRHLQLVPTPLASPRFATPLDAVLEEARFQDGMGRVTALPFLHAFARLRVLEGQPVAAGAKAIHALSEQMARAFGCDRPGRPYNLLLTRDWLLFVPRRAAAWQGVGVNALGFAGALMVSGREKLETLRRAGPLAALTAVAVPASAG